MPIKNQMPAYQYGLSLLGNQQGPNQAGALGGIERAVNPIIGALLMKQGMKQQDAADQSDAQAMADALLKIQSGGDIGQVLAGNPRLAQQFGPALLGQQMEYNSPQAKYDREVSAYDRKGKEVDALNDGVQNTLERSLARGDRANEMVNTRNFQRDQTQAAQDFQRQQQEDTQAFTAQENAANRANPGAGADQTMAGWGLYSDPSSNAQFRMNSRTGEARDLNNQPYKPGGAILLSQDPGATFNQSASRSGGRAAGVAAEMAPVLDANFSQITKTLDAFDTPSVKAEAKWALGAGSYAPTIPGVNSDFRARRDQLKGQAFLQSYQSLKGGGAITEVEGLKGEASIARLNDAQTPSEFYEALKDAKATFAEIYAAAKDRANRGAVVPQLQQQGGAAQPAKSLNWNDLQ